MEATDILQAFFRWIHVVAGITWIGLLYFFNWVNSAFAPTMDGETKKKVVPELLPRTLFWFRWGAAYTWITGVILLLLVFYHGGLVLEEPTAGFSVSTYVMLAVTFLGVFLYDILYKSPLGKKPLVATAVSFVLIVVAVLLMTRWAGFGYRSYVIHAGALFGTIMAFNVWFRIWPAQQKIITAIKNGDAPDPALAGLAGMRSKHNTYLSVPLVWAMINAHNTFASTSPIIFFVVVLLGWHIVQRLYKKSAKVPGF